MRNYIFLSCSNRCRYYTIWTPKSMWDSFVFVSLCEIHTFVSVWTLSFSGSVAVQGISLSLGHLILATPFPQHYKGPSRTQTVLVQMKDRAWENDLENFQKEFSRHRETLCSAGNGLSHHFSFSFFFYIITNTSWQITVLTNLNESEQKNMTNLSEEGFIRFFFKF